MCEPLGTDILETFFISWWKVWRSKYTDSLTRMLLHATWPHQLCLSSSRNLCLIIVFLSDLPVAKCYSCWVSVFNIIFNQFKFQICKQQHAAAPGRQYGCEPGRLGSSFISQDWKVLWPGNDEFVITISWWLYIVIRFMKHIHHLWFPFWMWHNPHHHIAF